MKIALLALLLSITSTTSQAQGLDGTPSLAAAKRIALEFAVDGEFAEILDHDSKVLAKLLSQDSSEYVFAVTSEGCEVVVSVSKELGSASNERPMTCNE